MNDEKDYSREDDAAIRSVQRRLDKQEAMAEASKTMAAKFAKEVFRDKLSRNAIARDCIDGIQGKKINYNDPGKLAGRDGARVPSTLIDEPFPTGFDKMPWQEDDEE